MRQLNTGYVHMGTMLVMLRNQYYALKMTPLLCAALEFSAHIPNGMRRAYWLGVVAGLIDAEEPLYRPSVADLSLIERCWWTGFTEARATLGVHYSGASTAWYRFVQCPKNMGFRLQDEPSSIL